mgnify:FL=1|jgi:hypothetical protein
MKTNLARRQSIMELEVILNHAIQDGAAPDGTDDLGLKHFFTPTDDVYGCSTYARELTIPTGMLVVGKIHKKPHLAFLMKGTMLVTTEEGDLKRMTAPMSFVVPAGVKRAAYIEEEITIVNVHLTKETEEANLSKVEEEVISPSYEAMGLEEPDLTGLNNFLSNLDAKIIE